MANLGNNGFDATTVDPTSSFEPLPNGKYPMVITESELKETKDRTGHYLQLTIEVIDGQFKGRKVWERLNIDNKSESAREIAQRTLSAICHATGKLKISDSCELHGIPFIGVVKYRPASGNFDASNDMKGYESYKGQVQGQGQQQQTQAPKQQDQSVVSEQPQQQNNSGKSWF